MRFDAFNLIVEKMDEVLLPKQFSRDPEDHTEPEGTAVIYRSEDALYSVLYHKKGKRFELKTAPVEDTPQWKKLSVWLFNPEEDKMSDAEVIANDFTETVKGPKKSAAVAPVRKKKKGEDSNNDPVFFLNRLANVFPELRDELNREKIEYGTVRAFTFSKEKVLPKWRDLAKNYSDSDVFKKLCELLSDMYKEGDMDTRSLITNVLINGLDEQEAEIAIAQFDKSLQDAAAAERKLIGKKIRPEKKPKPKKVTVASLNDVKKY